VLAWRLSNTMDVSFCVSALEEALARFGTPEIFNTDQGSQFTSAAFTGVLMGAGVRISMDGRGRWMDNVFIERLWRSRKHEDIYLKAMLTAVRRTRGSPSERTYRCRRTRRFGVMCVEQGACVRRRSWAGYTIDMFEFEFPTGGTGSLHILAIGCMI
jgi:transposase InsO family protein